MKLINRDYLIKIITEVEEAYGYVCYQDIMNAPCFDTDCLTKEPEVDEYACGFNDCINTITNRLEPLKTEESTTVPCHCYEEGHRYLKDHGTCNGTKDREPCTCGGDERKCDYYGQKNS